MTQNILTAHWFSGAASEATKRQAMTKEPKIRNLMMMKKSEAQVLITRRQAKFLFSKFGYVKSSLVKF